MYIISERMWGDMLDAPKCTCSICKALLQLIRDQVERRHVRQDDPANPKMHVNIHKRFHVRVILGHGLRRTSAQVWSVNEKACVSAFPGERERERERETLRN
jgi:hypothetical protein